MIVQIDVEQRNKFEVETWDKCFEVEVANVGGVVWVRRTTLKDYISDYNLSK